jgi:SAM-dependent methyltransferase
MSEAQLTSYEEVPYGSKPLYPTHPDCVATVATLMGMRPAAVESCRVLELGCATGGNLIPMAATLPGSRFVGIDLSPRQIAEGQKLVEALRLSNIRLAPLSILDVGEDFGQFDYIVCHGVYSWVPPAVQDKILDICSRNLSPGGVAYVSYNTYPGWHARGMVREMMGFHAKRFDDPNVRVGQARAFLEFVTKGVTEQDSAYARVLREEAEMLRPKADYYLFHEHLEDVNQPLYFHEFADRLAAKHLQYLGEAWFHTNPAKLAPDVWDTLQQLSADLIALEQYLDFLDNRTFRRTLICHDTAQLDRAPSAGIVSKMHMSALARPVSQPVDLTLGVVEEFRSDEGASASTNIPAVKAALLVLFNAWPASLSFEELWREVQRCLAPKSTAGTAEALAESLVQCYLSNVVALHVSPARFAVTAGARPLASPLARCQSKLGQPIANLRHRIVELSEVDRLVLDKLDGRTDRAALAAALGESPGRGAEQHDSQNGQWLESSLDRLARSALLEVEGAGRSTN